MYAGTASKDGRAAAQKSLLSPSSMIGTSGTGGKAGKDNGRRLPERQSGTGKRSAVETAGSLQFRDRCLGQEGGYVVADSGPGPGQESSVSEGPLRQNGLDGWIKGTLF